MDKNIKLLKALADNTRFKIVKLLMNGEKCVCEIFPHVKRTQSTTSIQLNVLRKAGILDSRKEGKKAFYKIKNPLIIKLIKLLEEK